MLFFIVGVHFAPPASPVKLKRTGWLFTSAAEEMYSVQASCADALLARHAILPNVRQERVTNNGKRAELEPRASGLRVPRSEHSSLMCLCSEFAFMAAV